MKQLSVFFHYGWRSEPFDSARGEHQNIDYALDEAACEVNEELNIPVLLRFHSSYRRFLVVKIMPKSTSVTAIALSPLVDGTKVKRMKFYNVRDVRGSTLTVEQLPMLINWKDQYHVNLNYTSGHWRSYAYNSMKTYLSKTNTVISTSLKRLKGSSACLGNLQYLRPTVRFPFFQWSHPHTPTYCKKGIKHSIAFYKPC